MPATQTQKDQSHMRSLKDKIDELLLESRKVFLADPVSNESAQKVIEKLMYLELKDPGKPILFVINSPGGSVDAGFAIWDQIKLISSPVTTLITGMAASMGSVLSLCAPKGKRYITPNARVMIHQPSIHAVIQGQASDLTIHADEIEKTRKSIIDVYCEATGRDFDTVAKAIDRDKWMSPEEAKEWGLVDHIVDSYTSIKL